MLNWANRFNIFCFLDNQDYSIQPQQYECLLAAGVSESVSSDNLKDVDTFLNHDKRWVFGHLSYELKNAIHHLSSAKADKIGFPNFFFFEPQFLLQIKGKELVIEGENCEKLFNEIQQQEIPLHQSSEISVKQKLSKEEYIQKIRNLQQ